MAFIIPNVVDTASGAKYENLDQSEPDSLDFEILGNTGRSGVLSGCEVTSNSSPSNVAVSAGTIILNGISYTVNANASLLVPATPLSVRYDIVLARVSGGTATLTVVSGNDDVTNPRYPKTRAVLASGVTFDGAIHIDTETDVVLAAIYRDSAEATVTSQRIVDKRTMVSSSVPNQGTTAPSGGSTGSLYYKKDTASGSSGSGIFVKNASGAWVETTQLADNNITNAQLRDSTGLSVIGRSANTPGDPADIVAGTDGHILRRSGSSLGFGTVLSSSISDFTENVQDIVGAMVSSNTESGISVTYQDSDGTLDFNVNDPTISLTGDVTGSATMTDLGNVSIATTVNAEVVQDIVGAMVSGNTESGISVTYDDTENSLDFNVNDPTITLTGDVTGSATMTNLGNVSITTTVADDSHNHVVGNIDSFTENVQDIVGGMVTGNTESNILVTYQDSDGTLDFEVNVNTLISYTSYTPTFTVISGTSPVVGTGGTRIGYYTLMGEMVHCIIYIKFGTSGYNFGSGNYLIGLPLAADSTTGMAFNLGSGYCVDSNNGDHYSIVAKRYSGYECSMTNTSRSGIGDGISSTTPFTFSTSDYISLNLTYVRS